MKLALIGYGKMGKEIGKIAQSRGHEIGLIIDIDNPHELTIENLQKCDVAIEFTIPATAVDNYYKCFEAGIPVVSGTTGWLSRRDEVQTRCLETNGTFFYGSNFSVGVNLFFELNRKLAELMAPHPDYKPEITEVHHTQKLDAPSGTGLSLAEDIIGILPDIEKWVEKDPPAQNELLIRSERVGEVPGIHTIRYDSEIDFIEITHSAKSRKGFALGAVLAAEYSLDKKGILTMKDLLKI
jgi:4-hydroxy-tetrahydrodipicolinate reductase